jgi:hypothetical protein
VRRTTDTLGRTPERIRRAGDNVAAPDDQAVTVALGVGVVVGVVVGVGVADAAGVIVEVGVGTAPMTRFPPPPPHAASIAANPAANPHVFLPGIRLLMVAPVKHIILVSGFGRQFRALGFWVSGLWSRVWI